MICNADIFLIFYGISASKKEVSALLYFRHYLKKAEFGFLCGMPKSIVAFCDNGKYHDIDVEDDVTIFARYENGATGTFITSTGEYPGTNRLEISGSKGKIVLENGILKWWKLCKDERDVCVESDQGFAEIDYEYSEITCDEPESAHKGILQNFVNAILYGEELIAPGTDGIFELTLSNAAYLSSWKNNCEITIPFDSTEFDEKIAELSQIAKNCKGEIEQSHSSEYKERWKVRW
ncbi:MAG: hypothetical protein IKD04_10055 [Clostridia bacterium]|nr:hypothetical protein [Clostridia bacterium]